MSEDKRTLRFESEDGLSVEFSGAMIHAECMKVVDLACTAKVPEALKQIDVVIEIFTALREVLRDADPNPTIRIGRNTSKR
jgi:hypothetical protein